MATSATPPCRCRPAELPALSSGLCGAVPAYEGAAATLVCMQEMLGDVDALANPAGSLAAYRAALELQRGRGGGAASAKLLNNAAVMHYRAGQFEGARHLVEEALQRHAEGASPVHPCVLSVLTAAIVKVSQRAPAPVPIGAISAAAH